MFEVIERRRKVYLHVGAPKTGTTYLQDVLWNNRDALRRSGVLYPGLSKDAQFHAAMDLQQTYFQEHLDPAVPGAWQRLVGQARVWRGDAVLSHELFSLVDERAATRALGDLAWADVHIVLTARDLARQLPAVWQEDVKNRQVLTFAEFARELAAPGPDAHYLANQPRHRDRREHLRDQPGDRVEFLTGRRRDKPAASPERGSGGPPRMAGIRRSGEGLPGPLRNG